MNNKIAIGAIAGLVVLVGIVVFVASNNKQTTKTRNVDMTDMSQHTESEKPTSTVQEASNIVYKGFAVSPKSITVKKGTTVTWTNQDDAKHDVTPDTETADFKASELFGKGESHKVTFNTVGTYPYHCSPHPYMKGSIEVVE